MTRKKMSAFFQLPSQSTPPPKEQKSSVHPLLLVSRKATVVMHVNLLHGNFQMGVIRIKVYILINPTVQWHMLTHSE